MGLLCALISLWRRTECKSHDVIQPLAHEQCCRWEGLSPLFQVPQPDAILAGLHRKPGLQLQLQHLPDPSQSAWTDESHSKTHNLISHAYSLTWAMTAMGLPDRWPWLAIHCLSRPSKLPPPPTTSLTSGCASCSPTPHCCGYIGACTVSGVRCAHACSAQMHAMHEL